MAQKSKEQRLFGAACLKLTLEARTGSVTDLYRETLEELDLTADEVDAYLAEHRDVIQAALRARGQPRN